MTEFKINPGDENKPTTLKVPIGLIVPIWSIVAAVVGTWYTMYNTQRDQQQAIAIVSHDVSTLKGSMANIERTVSIYSDTAYTIGDASRDQGAVKSELGDHEARIRALEKRRR